MQLDNNNYSVFFMHYHLTLVVKYRREVISSQLMDGLLHKQSRQIANTKR